MAIERLAHVGPELLFEVRPASIPTKISRRPLLVMGVAKYIIDVFDSSGQVNTEAQLTGPGVTESALQSTATWLTTKTKTIYVTIGGIQKAQLVPNSATIVGAVTLAAYLTQQFVADAATGFGGCTFSAVYDTDATEYKLMVSTIQEGDAIKMVVDTDTDTTFGFDAVKGRSYYGFGNYHGYDVVIPFASFPDPDSILDKCVLDSTFSESIEVGVNLGSAGMKYMSTTAAFERNAYHRPSPLSIIYGATTTALAAYAPFTYAAAKAAPPVLYPWDPVGGETNKFWCPGETASFVIPDPGGDSTKYAIIEVVTNLDATKETSIPLSSSEVPDAHGVRGNLTVTIDVAADPAAITLDVGAGTLQIDLLAGAKTFADLEAAFAICDADATNAARGVFKRTYVGAIDDVDILAATRYMGGGVAPVTYDASAANCQLLGLKLFDDVAADGNALANPVELWLSIDGSPIEKFSWPATTKIYTVVEDIKAIFGAASADFLDVSGAATNYVVRLKGAATEKGRAGCIYIAKCTNIGEIFTAPVLTLVAVDDYTVDGDFAFVTMLSDSDPMGLVLPGDTITQGALSATVSHVQNNAGAWELYLDAPTAFTSEAEDEIVITSHILADDYLYRRHYGTPYAVAAGDTLWRAGSQEAMLVGVEAITGRDGTTMGNAGVELASTFATTKTFALGYIRAENITAAAIGDTRPTPELTVSLVSESISIRNEGAMDQFGKSYTGVPLKMYTGFEAVRTDITAAYLSRALSFTTIEDIQQYGEIDPRNEFVFGLWAAYQGMQLDASNIPFKGIAIEGDTLSDWMNVTKVTEKDSFWMPIALTDNVDVNEWLATYVAGAMISTRKKDWATLLTYANPTEAYAETVGTGLTGATNGLGTETTFTMELDALNVAAALTAAGKDPGAVAQTDGLYIKLSGGGATDTEATKKWLISSVVAQSNQVIVTTSPTEGLNDDSFYSTDNPPVVTSATITIYERGAAITTAEDKGTALQAVSDSFACRKVCVCPSDGVDAPDYNGNSLRLANYFGTAALAGYIQTHQIENPVSGWTIPWLDHVYGTDDLYDDVDSIMRLFFLVNAEDSETVEVAMDFTTDSSTTKAHRFTVNAELDALAFRIRAGVATWKKMSISERTLETLYAQVDAAGAATTQEREIKRFDLDTIELGAPDTSEGGSGTNSEIDAVTIYGTAEAFIPVGKLFVYITA